MKRPLLTLLALSLLAGCGIRGGLERPPPMWGDERQRYEDEQARAAEEAARQAREEEQRRQVTPTAPEPSAAQPPETPTDVNPTPN
jgi:hypothetical protein